MNAQAASSVQSIDRVFEIIETLAESPNGFSIADICTKTALPKGTVSRLLATLINRAYVAQDASTRQYRLTLKMFDIGSKVIGSVNILSVAQPYLERLSLSCNEVVHMVTRVENEVVYLYKEDASGSIVRMASTVGQRSPMYCTGVGKSILAFLPEEEVQKIWDSTELIRYTPNTIISFERMQQELAQIRRQGYAIDNEEHEISVRCIAVPVLDYNNVPIAAISISASVERMTDGKIRDFLPMLHDTVKNIQRYYGVDER